MYEVLKGGMRKRRPRSLKTVIAHDMHLSRRKIFVGTQKLTPVTVESFKKFLAQNAIDRRKWVKGVQECDHFALYLVAAAKMYYVDKIGKNAAVGQVWGASTVTQKAHAFNFIITPEMKIRYFEPQEDHEIYPVGRKIFVQI